MKYLQPHHKCLQIPYTKEVFTDTTLAHSYKLRALVLNGAIMYLQMGAPQLMYAYCDHLNAAVLCTVQNPVQERFSKKMVSYITYIQ